MDISPGAGSETPSTVARGTASSGASERTGDSGAAGGARASGMDSWGSDTGWYQRVEPGARPARRNGPATGEVAGGYRV